MVFGLVVIGFGDSTGFGMSKVVVLRFSTAFGVSKVVGVRIWGGLGCLSFILGFRWLSRDEGWRFDGFDSVCVLTWHGCGWRRKGGRLRRFRGYQLAWGGDVAGEQVVGGGQAVGNGAGSGWGLPSRVRGRNDGDVAP